MGSPLLPLSVPHAWSNFLLGAGQVAGDYILLKFGFGFRLLSYISDSTASTRGDKEYSDEEAQSSTSEHSCSDQVTELFERERDCSSETSHR